MCPSSTVWSLRLRFMQPRATHCCPLRQTLRLPYKQPHPQHLMLRVHVVIHREDDPSLAVDYECESEEMADSGRLEQLPDCLQAADYEPSNKRAHSVIHATDMYRSMFGSDDEDDPPTPELSSKPLPAQIFSVRSDDDGVSHRGKIYRGAPASVGTTTGSADNKMSSRP